jgi:hypothetical protein
MRQGSISFLKKRNKKLFLIWRGGVATPLLQPMPQSIEVLPFFIGEFNDPANSLLASLD